MNLTQYLLLGILVLFSVSCSQKTTAEVTEEAIPFLANLPLEPISLDGLSSWNNPGANWQIAQNVLGDYLVDHDLQTEPGTGILVNLPTEEAKENLFSSWEHGDLELEIEFMMPRGSNSGIYLQGRYEVQLLDSWGKEDPKDSDCGGIYHRWDPERGKGNEGFEGHPPRVNASRAPNLWQKYHILFRAPKFNEAGEKIAPAKFEKVYHNGILIHDNIEVFGPTRAAAFEDEVATGPLMIQGDHGPVAFRNIRYKKYGDKKIGLGELSYQIYDYEDETRPNFDSLELIQEGTADSFLVAQISEKKDHFAMRFSGEINVPVSGTYLFQTLLDDGGDLYIDGKAIVQNGGELEFERQSGSIDLTEGVHSLELTFFQVTWRAHATIFYEGPEMELQSLASLSPFADRKEPKPFIVEPGNSPEMIRGFVNYKDEKRTQVLSVGFPEGVHYSYDLEEGALLTAWKGGFANVREMWVGRGHSQLFQPLNAAVETTSGIPFAQMSEAEANWPKEIPSGYRSIGYHLDESLKPIFEYTYGTLSWEDSFQPLPNQKGLSRSVEISTQESSEGLLFRIAQAKHIDRMPNGLYRVGGQYFIDTHTLGERVKLIPLGSVEALVVELPESPSSPKIQYDIIW